MKRVLITGLSGVGKSTVIDDLAARGYRAVDLDQPGWSITGADGDWVWDLDRVRELLDSDDELIFVSGTSANQGQLRSRFDLVVLLSVPVEVMRQRLLTRTTNDFGKAPDELAAALAYKETVEPLLRRTATCEIDTRASREEVLAALLAAVSGTGEE